MYREPENILSVAIAGGLTLFQTLSLLNVFDG
jgi:hypothetical protein